MLQFLLSFVTRNHSLYTDMKKGEYDRDFRFVFIPGLYCLLYFIYEYSYVHKYIAAVE